MRTDIKIGVSVLLVLLVLAVLWMIFSAPPKTNIDDKPAIETTPSGTLEVERPVPGGISAEDIGPQAIRPALPARDSLDDIIGGIDEPDTTGIGVPPAAAVPGVPQSIDDPVAPAIVPPLPAAEDIIEAGVPMPLGPDNGYARQAVPSSPPATTERKHTIKEGETLWIIAEIEYGPGNGKYWQKIQDANHGLDSSSLRVGQTIKIPALVREPVAGSFGPGITDTLTPTGGGQKMYVVTEGDSLWKIASRPDVYGNGAKWQLIASANPNVNINALKPGMKLVIPSVDASSSAAAGNIPTQSGVVQAGQSIYVVQEGDAGMWGVAVKKLGNGKYWPAIAKMNRGVNPSNLKPGMKLVIPSLQQAKQAIGDGVTLSAESSTPRASSTPRPAPAGDGEPVFD